MDTPEQSSNLIVQAIQGALQKLIGLHRQLLDAVRMEKDALAQADLSGIQEATCAKEALVEAIRQQESQRIEKTRELGRLWRKAPEALTLSAIAIAIQARDPKSAEQLRSSFNALTLLIQRIREQNDHNRGVVERSLEHIKTMKRNVLGEAAPRSDTYGQQGRPVPGSAGPSGSRLISREA